MESENFEEISDVFNQIDIENNPGSEKNEQYVYKPYQYKPPQRTRRIIPKPIDFEKYVWENCENKFKILDRSTFHEIKRPIIIFFHHFREKCIYHSKWLDRIYQLSFKYGDQIEFIAADMIDIDVINPKWNPLSHFCRIRPEDESPNIYVIDEKKRIHEHFDGYQTIESLSELCENLLNGKLYPSQAIPENNNEKLVKICVSDNYEDVILKSTKDILLISTLEHYLQYEPNYENVALQLKDLNVDIVYMEAEKNYIPFEYNVNNSLPTILFIPHNDKKNFIYFEDYISEENLVTYVQELVGNSEILKLKQEEQQTRNYQRKPLIVPDDFKIDFMELPQYLEDQFENWITVLGRKNLDKINKSILVIYMNFQGKCLAHHIRWLDKIYQVAVNSYSIQYLVADFKDINIINSKWKPEDFINPAANPKDEIPKIFGIDRCKYAYEFKDFKSVSSLYYFTFSLTSGDFYYSECYPKYQEEQLVEKWIADSFNVLLKKSKRDVFITFYDPDHKATEKLLNTLEEIASDIKNKNLFIKVVKFNVKENYVHLEYASNTYPIHYFISRRNKKKSIRLEDSDRNKDKMLEFILDCMQKY